MRKLASVQRILAIESIPDADKIVKAQINGWWVVTSIDNGFKVGDLVCYIEIDSWSPFELTPFLSKGKEPRVFDGVRGERLRTIKLRGQLSQGLILPLNDVNDYMANIGKEVNIYELDDEGFDLTELLNIKKWEPPMNAQLQGVCRSTFPSHIIPKTDQERCQNITREVQSAYDNNDLFEITRKYDGSSMTVYKHNEDSGICSRNMLLETEQECNTFVDTAKGCGIYDAVLNYGKNIAVQGELVEPNIQGNPEKLADFHYFVFDIFNIDEQRYLTPDERHSVYLELAKHCNDRFHHVDIIGMDVAIPSRETSELLKYAEGKNNVGVEREGLVYKRVDGKFSFKAISNKFLLSSDNKE